MTKKLPQLVRVEFCFEVVSRRFDPDVDKVAPSTCSHEKLPQLVRVQFCFEIVSRRFDPDVDKVAPSTCSHEKLPQLVRVQFCFEIVSRRFDPDVDKVAPSTCSHEDSDCDAQSPSASATLSSARVICSSHAQSCVFRG